MDYSERELVVVTRSGKVAIENVMEDEDPQKHEEGQGVEEQNLPIRLNLTKEPQKEPKQQVQVPKVIHPLPNIPPPFPQRLKKKNEDEKFKKNLSVFKSLSINFPQVEALLEMSGYAKYMKELVTKKRSLDYETIEVPHSCSAIMTNHSITKREDPGAFTIPRKIGMLHIAKALCDLGASINLMPYAIYKKLGLGEPKATTMSLLMADRSIKHPMRVLFDILVKVDRFIFPADFVILDCEIDVENLIILGRPFLAIGRALVDVESGKLKFRVNDDESDLQYLYGTRLYGGVDGRLLSRRGYVRRVLDSLRTDPPKMRGNESGSELGEMSHYGKTMSYLLGTKVIVHTDHAALRYLKAKKDAKPQLIRLEEWANVEHEVDIDDSFPDERVFAISLKHTMWYADFTNYIVCGIMPDELTFYQQKRFLFNDKKYFWDEPYLFRECVDHVIRRCVPEEEAVEILHACHTSPVGDHHGGIRTAAKVLQNGYYWPSL
ncbi:uncharacterized protein LOC125838472 [Solanum verrucosum]|uniref:uncharacterized protein LOC125838472 n=1 Tax=Solanum verrucosum TaxID=315347 RepID=UPI0020D1BBEA|nr:uncharacterized protein LOC125838472 [Solanum verrucosum]